MLQSYFIIFLKYNQQGFGLLANIFLKNKELCGLSRIKSFTLLNPNNIYFFLTKRGVYSNKQCLIKKLSGFYIVKV